MEKNVVYRVCTRDDGQTSRWGEKLTINFCDTYHRRIGEIFLFGQILDNVI